MSAHFVRPSDGVRHSERLSHLFAADSGQCSVRTFVKTSPIREGSSYDFLSRGYLRRSFSREHFGTLGVWDTHS